MSEQKCPKCGADEVSASPDRSVITFECAATWFASDGETVETKDCVIRQLAQVTAERDKAVERAEKAEALRNTEVDEFNMGWDAAKAGLPDDEPSDLKTDSWSTGYAWFHWPAIKADRDRLAAENKRLAGIVERPRPKIVCLCGSTRFKEAFDEANYQETMAGKIVLSVGFYMHATGNKHGGDGVGATPEQKASLDELHFRKIDLADEAIILNVGGYIGYSTGREIAYAKSHNKPIRYLEPVAAEAAATPTEKETQEQP